MNPTWKLSLRKCLNIRLLTILFIILGCWVVTSSALTGPTHCRTMVRAGETGGGGMPGSGQSRIRAGAAIAGTWNWVSNQILVIHPDGAFEVFEDGGKVNEGHWENLEGRRYRLRHRYGGYIDTVTLSDDGNTLDGTNNFRNQLHGSRRQGERGKAAGIAGTWNWVSGQILVIHLDRVFEVYKDGGKVNEGHWENLEGRRYRLRHRYGGYIDTVTLSDDANALDGTNNFGNQLHGSRE